MISRDRILHPPSPATIRSELAAIAQRVEQAPPVSVDVLAKRLDAIESRVTEVIDLVR